MSTSKHPTREPGDVPRDDLKDNPGIGTSRGNFAPDDEDISGGDSTFEGDVESDTTREGGVDPNQVGRTNK